MVSMIIQSKHGKTWIINMKQGGAGEINLTLVNGCGAGRRGATQYL